MRQQMEYIGQCPAFPITGETAKKLKKTSPSAIDRYLKKGRDALRVKGKSPPKPRASLKSRIPIRAFYAGITAILPFLLYLTTAVPPPFGTPSGSVTKSASAYANSAVAHRFGQRYA